MRGIFHDFQANGDRFAGLGVPELFVQLGTANNISEEDRYFLVSRHEKNLW